MIKRTGALLLFYAMMPGVACAAEIFIGGSVNWAQLEGKNSSINDLQSDIELGFSLAARSLDNYWPDSSFGYYFEAGLDTYHVERDDIWGLTVPENIHTSARGEYLYLTPVVFYEFNRKTSRDWALKIGLGIGLGYLSVRGTMIVNAPGSASVETISGSDFSYSTGFIIRYEYHRLTIQAKEFVPKGRINGLDLELQLPVISVGYTFVL